MTRTLLLILAIPLAVNAQAPIERRAPPSPTKSDQAWAHLESLAAHNDSEELRIQAFGQPIRCNLDGVTASELFCTEYRALAGPGDFIFPRQPFRIPRADVVEVRAHGRDYSTLLGAAIGFGFGAAKGAQNGGPDAGSNAVLLGAITGFLGGAIGHFIPFKGHILYRAH